MNPGDLVVAIDKRYRGATNIISKDPKYEIEAGDVVGHMKEKEVCLVIQKITIINQSQTFYDFLYVVCSSGTGWIMANGVEEP